MKILISIFIAFSLVIIAGCAVSPTYTEDQMYQLATELTRLSSSVEATVRYNSPPAAMSDQDLLQQATEHDPALLTPFKDYRLRVLRKNRHAVVLVCSRDDKALLEDAGCTGQFESHRWESKDQPCEFTLNVGQVCK